jgi:hypothetical protein
VLVREKKNGEKKVRSMYMVAGKGKAKDKDKDKGKSKDKIECT